MNIQKDFLYGRIPNLWPGTGYADLPCPARPDTDLYEVHESPVPGVTLLLRQGHNRQRLQVELLPVEYHKALTLHVSKQQDILNLVLMEGGLKAKRERKRVRQRTKERERGRQRTGDEKAREHEREKAREKEREKD